MKQKLMFNKWIRLLLMMLLLIAVSTTVTQAQEPIPPQPEEGSTQPAKPTFARHRPGRLAKANNLDVLLEQGQISDPLANNTTLVTWDKIALIWEDENGNKLTTKTYDVNTSLDSPIAKHRNPLSATVDGAGQMDIAAGYLGGTTGWIDTVAAWEHPSGKISMYLEGYDADLGVNVDRLWVDIGEQVAGGYSSDGTSYGTVYGAFIRLATGDFDADGYDEFVLAWEGPNKSLNLQVYDTDGGLDPTAKGKIADEKLNGGKFLDVATGDFDGDGDAEIAVAWQGQGLSVKVYDVDLDGKLTAEAKLANEATPGQLAIATGDFNGDHVDEIAVGYNTQTQANLYLYQVSDNLHTLTREGTASQSSGRALSGDELIRSVGVGAGDFDADGIDEVAFVYGNPLQPDSGDGYCYVQVYAADASLELTPKARVLSNWLTAYGNLSMAVGDMNQDVVSEIVVASTWSTASLEMSDISLGIFQVDPDLNAVRQKGHLEQDEEVSWRGGPARQLAVAVGGFDGKNVRVGPPTYQRLVDTKQVIAVINAPPKHEDVVDGETVDINVTDTCIAPIGPPCTYTKYETEQKTTTTMGLTTTRDWGVSSELDAKYWFVKTSLTTTYGEKFEKTTTSFKTTEFGQDVEANHDDAIVRLEQDLDVWEYPVYAEGSDAVQGYIQVTWPVKVDPACSSNCEAAITAVIDGKNPLSYYQPNHEYGNILSYSIDPPTDISATVKSDTMRYLGVNPYQMWVSWSDVEDSETKQSSKMDLKDSLEVSGFGQKLKVEGHYNQGENSVNKVSFEEDTSIHLYFWEIEPEYSYGVRPIYYWAEPDGRLVLDYAVTPLIATPATWWQTTYDKPDPAINLPWKEHPPAEDYRLLSKEITFDPASPIVGEEVTIIVKVRNYSLIGVNNVPVSVYAGDPDDGGIQIGETTLTTINPMSSSTASAMFDTSGHSGQTVDIYAVIDPDNTLEEMHTDNNKGYAQLPVKPPDPEVPPTTLSITADGIAFTPEAPAAGGEVHVMATINASGDTFTHVGVELWDGDPARGGRLISGRLIPMILNGQTGMADFRWDTAGLRGVRDIWVVIQKHPDEHASTDNRAHKILNLEPHRLHLPAVWKD